MKSIYGIFLFEFNSLESCVTKKHCYFLLFIFLFYVRTVGPMLKGYAYSNLFVLLIQMYYVC